MMNLSVSGIPNNKEVKFNLSNKATTLNPNAAEFVPSSFKSTHGSPKSSGTTRFDVPGTSKKTILDQSESIISSSSDDEAHQYWHHQLPDDITPDFKDMGEDQLLGLGNLSLASLSMQDGHGTSRFIASAGSQTLSEKVGYSNSTYVEDQSSDIMASAATSWGKPFVNRKQYGTNGRDMHHNEENSVAGLMSGLTSGSLLIEDAAINSMKFLSAKFPGFASQSLADVFYGNGCDLNLTVELLTQLENQVDGGVGQNMNSKSFAPPSPSMLDFSSLTIADSQNDYLKFYMEDTQQAANMYKSPSSIVSGDTYSALPERELASLDARHWRYRRDGSSVSSGGSSRSSQHLTSSFSHNRDMVSDSKLPNSVGICGANLAPTWLETGEAVANMYLESRKEAHDLAHLGNPFLEQAREAYQIGNKALAKELNMKGQFYNMQITAAHEKAKEAVYQQRHVLSSEIQGSGQGQGPVIDLRDLHQNEALHVLNYELSILKRTARSARQRLQAMILVGTGNYTKGGTRTPARLFGVIEQHLLDQGLHCTRAQPGLLRVVIY
ncbi:polyadenylate-binding protein-interacting protein 7-like [Typha angustifolia]|uniref:polyadenylate-binding protein-interacting protein 7-like n=1 Tax=Typha angustifolia TaxID=59011 RepID=UPI003C2F1483